jgi:antitoxin component YwqK of YwqJK toxin-antitoxin module
MRRLLLLALLFLPVLPVFAQELLYRSNSFGMLLERIEPYLRDQSDWIVGIRKAGARETRRLYSRGKEVRRWEVSWSTDGTQKIEREFAHNAMVARRLFDASGDLLQEEEYAAGAVTQKSVFTYRGDRLVRMRVLKGDGTLLYAEQYVYAINGVLREVRRTESGDGVRLSLYVFGPTGLSEERNTGRDVLLIARYDTRGRVTNREQRRGDQTLSREDFTYRADGDHLLSSVERLPAQDVLIERAYDEEGRLSSETSRTAGTVREEIAYERDKQGRLIGKTRRSPAGLETWKYTLDSDGKTTREEYYRRGLLERITDFGEGKLRTEELYREDGLFLKVYYDGDQRLREEVYEGGKLLRERTYP